MRPKAKKYTKEEIELASQKLKETQFEKGDLLALIIAALTTFVPAMLLVIGFMLGIVWLIFLR